MNVLKIENSILMRLISDKRSLAAEEGVVEVDVDVVVDFSSIGSSTDKFSEGGGLIGVRVNVRLCSWPQNW